MASVNSKESQNFIIQTLFVDEQKNKPSLLGGGYTHTMTIGELIALVKKVHNIEQGEKIGLIGVGAADTLKGEVVYDGRSIFQAYAKDGKIVRDKLDKNTPISFAQVMVKRTTKEGGAIILTSEQTKGVQGENGKDQIQQILIGQLGKSYKDKSYGIEIVANVSEIGARGFYRKYKDDREIERAEPFGNMAKGNDKVKPPEEVVSKPKDKVHITGIVTGKQIKDNEQLRENQHIHLHCWSNESTDISGHVTKLGTLSNIEVTIIPAERTYFLIDQERDKEGNKKYTLRESKRFDIKEEPKEFSYKITAATLKEIVANPELTAA